MNRAFALVAIFLSGCVHDDDPVGEAQATITQVPSDVACVQIQVVGTRTVALSYDVKAGTSSVFTLPRLPVGADTFTATAFQVSCSMIGMSSPDWASDPVVAVVSAGGLTQVALVMHQIGVASVSVDFPDGGALPDQLLPPATDGSTAPPPDLASASDAGMASTDGGCVPLTAMQACGGSGQVCGNAPNGCGGVVSCGSCPIGTMCCIDSCAMICP